MPRPKILLYHACPLNQTAGAQIPLCRTIELLKGWCDIVLAVPALPDWKDVNQKFGCAISEDQVRVLLFKKQNCRDRLLSFFDNYRPLNSTIGKEASESDLCISFDNFGFFGVPSVHFVSHVGIFNTMGIRGPKIVFNRIANGRKGVLVSEIYAFLRSLLGIVLMRKSRFIRKCKRNGDRIVANSNWVAGFFRKENIAVDCLYPPVIQNFQHIPFRNRRSDFIYVGRISREKRIDRIIEILARVRERGNREFNLHIVGPLKNEPFIQVGSAYFDYIVRLANQYPWVKLEGSAYNREKEDLLTSCRYAIQACEIETFGISVAEYLKAGCIPFVPAECGAAEVVGLDSLVYHSVDDAVVKILQVLDKSLDEQSDIQSKLLERGAMFRAEDFDEGVLKIVIEELFKRGFAIHTPKCQFGAPSL